MAAILFTGFPGFLGSKLLPRALARDPNTRAVCLIQAKYAELARSRRAEIEAACLKLLFLRVENRFQSCA